LQITASIFNAARPSWVKLIFLENPSGPAVVIRPFRAAPDSLRTLSAGFFDVVLNPTAARIFGLLKFRQALPDSLVERLRSFVMLEGSSEILRVLVEIIETTVQLLLSGIRTM
jgi:hypothetical protein